MADNLLQLNADKTEVLISAPPCLVPKIREGLRALTLSVKSSIRNLGITMHQALTVFDWLLFFPAERENETQAHCVSSRDGNINLRFISSCLDYCNSVSSCLCKTSPDRLQVVQNGGFLNS